MWKNVKNTWCGESDKVPGFFENLTEHCYDLFKNFYCYLICLGREDVNNQIEESLIGKLNKEKIRGEATL